MDGDAGVPCHKTYEYYIVQECVADRLSLRGQYIRRTVGELADNDLIRRLAIFAALNLLILSLILVSVSGNGNDIFLGFILGFGFLLLFSEL